MYYKLIQTIDCENRTETKELRFPNDEINYSTIENNFYQRINEISQNITSGQKSLKKITHTLQIVRYQNMWDEETADVIREIVIINDVFSI